jgi:riboflavin biosynthesis pyrimidine reductase
LANVQLTELFAKVVGVRLSMVANAGLQTFGESKTSSDVSTTLDRELLIHLRKLSDLAITDTATAVAEGYKQSKHVDIEVWTKSGNRRGLSDLAAANELHELKVVHVKDEADQVNELLTRHKGILLETGLTLTKIIAGQKLIDEACITITGAFDEADAIAALLEMKAEIGLHYLPKHSHLWLDQTLFTRLER